MARGAQQTQQRAPIEGEIVSETVANPGDAAGEANSAVTEPRPQSGADMSDFTDDDFPGDL